MWVPGHTASHQHWTLTCPRRCRPGRRGAGCSTVPDEHFPPHTGDLTGRQGFRGSCCISGAAPAAGMQTLQRALGRKRAGERHTEWAHGEGAGHRLAVYMQDERKSVSSSFTQLSACQERLKVTCVRTRIHSFIHWQSSEWLLQARLWHSACTSRSWWLGKDRQGDGQL